MLPLVTDRATAKNFMRAGIPGMLLSLAQGLAQLRPPCIDDRPKVQHDESTEFGGIVLGVKY